MSVLSNSFLISIFILIEALTSNVPGAIVNKLGEIKAAKSAVKSRNMIDYQYVEKYDGYYITMLKY